MYNYTQGREEGDDTSNSIIWSINCSFVPLHSSLNKTGNEDRCPFLTR